MEFDSLWSSSTFIVWKRTFCSFSFCLNRLKTILNTMLIFGWTVPLNFVTKAVVWKESEGFYWFLPLWDMNITTVMLWAPLLSFSRAHNVLNLESFQFKLIKYSQHKYSQFSAKWIANNDANNVKGYLFYKKANTIFLIMRCTDLMMVVKWFFLFLS